VKYLGLFLVLSVRKHEVSSKESVTSRN